MRPPPRALDGYREPAGEEALQEVRAFAAPLRGARVLHVSFSPYGTVMAEQLGALIPLLRDQGLEADWQVASCPEEFAVAAHELYRALSGRRVRRQAARRLRPQRTRRPERARCSSWAATANSSGHEATCQSASSPWSRSSGISAPNCSAMTVP